MLIKNKLFFIFLLFLSLFIFNINLYAEEFNVSAKEIIIDKENEILIGKGSVVVKDSDGKIIYADKIIYTKSKEFILAEGNVTIDDNEGNILKTSKATYNKIKGVIVTYKNTEIIIKEGYKLLSKNISYNALKKIISSSENSIFTDVDGNKIETSMFQYDIGKNLFTSIGKIKISDIKNNKYFLKEIYIDTKTNEMIGSDISVVLDQENFGLSKKNDPRFASNNVFVTKNKTIMSKGIFTVCQKRDGKCPPWSIKAKKITHDKIKKNIYYEHATLKLYDIPVFYFPKFFHPDPTVKRQSGFLVPMLTNSTKVGAGITTPYYWAINNDKDYTFSPKFYSNENPLFLNEYRQVFENGFLNLDASFTEGYDASFVSHGNSSHVFGNLNLNLNNDDSYSSNLALKIQRTSNNTYFRDHRINTLLVNSENTDLINEIKYNYNKDDIYFNITSNLYQNLRKKKKSDQYEHIFPNILFGKTFFSEQFGVVKFKSNALFNKYETNKQRAILTNDVIWSPSNKTTNKGFVNTIEGMIRNTNYDTKKTESSTSLYNSYKDGRTINEISGVITNKISLPMKKDGINFSNLFSPNFMLRYAPGHMKNLRDNDTVLNYTNLYSLNKTSEIEDGLSAILGFDFQMNKKSNNSKEKEKFSLSLGQVFSPKRNSDIPSKSSLDQKMSDVVGEIDYNFTELSKIGYKFSVDHNFNDINYNEIVTELNFGKVQFNVDYLEENNHIGTEHYASTGVTLNLNEENKLGFNTKKNFETDSTELYNLSYQYTIDCLTAGLVYRREFYRDSDLEPNDNLMFTITFVPFGTASSPNIKQ